MLDEQLNIAKQNAALNDSTMKIIKLQFNSGQVTDLAVQQFEAQRELALGLIPKFEQNIAIQENALRILTGQVPDHIQRTATLENIILPEAPPTGLPAELLSQRPDVRSAELTLLAANSEVGIAKAEMYPLLRITASGGINSFRASNWFNIPASLFGIVGGSILQPVFDGKRLRTAYDVAKVNREKSVLDFRKTVLNAVGEVSDALVKMEKLHTQEEIAAHRVAVLHQATSNAGLLFENGMSSYLEVITAQSNVLQSELDYTTIKRDRLNAVSELYRSLGGGWK